jgi:hypothetical protein
LIVSENEDFVSFENALRDLKLQSEQLKKMVSQGDIRAFRVGDSMQFRAEDVAALQSRDDGEDDLVFADALEDDTGMVTEELSEEDTLLVEDDMDDVDDAPAQTVATRSRREAITATKAESGESPIWVAAAILCFIALLWGALISWDITKGASPEGSLLTKMWSTAK